MGQYPVRATGLGGERSLLAPRASDEAGSATQRLYGASTAALNRLTNALVIGVGGSGVRVNTVEPRSAVMSEVAEFLIGSSLG